MPFDLPAGAPSPLSLAAWDRAWHYRDFQDKQLRIIQYGCRGVAHALLGSSGRDGLRTKLVALCQQLSLARKAFRLGQSLADIKRALDFARDALAPAGGLSSMFYALHWAFMAGHIFWDHVFFCTSAAVKLIDVPGSRWWTNSQAAARMRNWRAMADVCGAVAAYFKYRSAMRASSQAVADGCEGDAVAAARSKQREAGYSFVKLAADVLTYWPQTTAAEWAGAGQAAGWHDSYIGLAGCVAALLSCRSEWIKLGCE